MARNNDFQPKTQTEGPERRHICDLSRQLKQHNCSPSGVSVLGPENLNAKDLAALLLWLSTLSS